MRAWLIASLVFVLAAGGALVVLAATAPEDSDVPPVPDVTVGRDEPDPLAFEPGSEADLERRAAAGHSHIVYALSPGGVNATARRVVRYRPKIERAARSAGVDPDLVEAMIFLESAGRPEVSASRDLDGAVGLGQILASTGTSLLGMRVDVEASTRLTRRIRRADARGRPGQARRLRRARRRVDERFDPEKSLEATGRYLKTALAGFGREDLAVVSYHMGIGNLKGVLEAYGTQDASWARVYFDATPDRHPRTFRLLAQFSDESASYLWRVLASKEIMRLWREDREELGRRIAGEASGEVRHAGAADREPVSFPNDEAVTGLRAGPLAGEVRPEAAALAMYVGAQVRAISGRSPLVVSAASGWTFDVLRRYRSRRQALAF
ncbi:MAG: transglycosylase SLT domain-containing protein, partial [Thermoleophilaceae bacterium]